MSRILAMAVLVAAFLCTTTLFPAVQPVSAGGVAPPHPLINRAINALENAKGDLQSAAQVYCGHREAALGAVNDALGLLHQAIACENAHGASAESPELLQVNDPLALSISAGGAPPHPRISAAINALQSARGDLADAAHTYCGKRAEALGAVDHALGELRAAIACEK
ncbi:MAG TPA: hypothetical protein VI756_22705 [Blastocatellia bacterium]